MKKVWVSIEGASSRSGDPVEQALKTLGFKKNGSNGSLNVFLLAYGGLGLDIPSFIGEVNSILRGKLSKGDKLFSPPRYDGQYVVSRASIGSREYSLGISAGSLLLRVKEKK